MYSQYFVELKELLDKYDGLSIHYNKIVSDIQHGLPEKEFNMIEFYDYLAKMIATYAIKDPIFTKIAGIYQIKIYDIEMGNNYIELIDKQYENNLISENFYSFISDNENYLINMIVWDRDYLIDYFGLKTLECSYLLKNNADKKLIERPQMMWLRTSIQIHGLCLHENIDLEKKLELIKETYDYMSQLYFTHATPTLFNSGSKYPQLSSCYLLQCPDDLGQIADSIKSIMMISKWAGGIGINLSDIRSSNSIIKSTGGKTNGIVPLCKTFESLARYVNQCFAKNTIVYSKNGPIKVKDIKINDELITKDGTFQKVLKIFKNNIDKEILKINSKHSFETIYVTKEHQIYCIKNQTNIKNQLKPQYIYANELNEGDYVGYPIPNFVEDSKYDKNYFRMYGIILINGNMTKTNCIELKLSLNTKTCDFVENYLKNKQINYSIDIEDNKTILIKWVIDTNKLPIQYEDLYDSESNKRIKNEYLNLPHEKILSLIEGLFETKYDIVDKDNICFNTTYLLAFSIKYLLLRIGILISGYVEIFSHTDNTQSINKNIYKLMIPKHVKLNHIFGLDIQYPTKLSFFEHENILWTKITNIDKEHYNDYVFDFNMDNNHNYLTDLGLVHNSGKRLGSIATFIEPWHADIEDFIQLRKNTGDENLRTRDLFLGLWVSDGFMKAIESDTDWYLMNPLISSGLTDCWGNEFETLYAKYVSEGKYIKKIKARELYKKITECQFETGMPYMMFKDNVNARSNQQNLGTIKNSNLCVAPETQILTDNGYFKISELKDKYVNVWNGEKFSKVIVKQTGINQKLIKVNFSNNVFIETTPYHKFYINKTNSQIEIIEASKLQKGMELIKFNLPILNIKDEMENFDKISYDKYFVPINYSIKTKVKWLSKLIHNYNDDCVLIKQIDESIQINSTNLDFLKNIRLMFNTMGENLEITNSNKNIDKSTKLKNYYKLSFKLEFFNQLEQYAESKQIIESECTYQNNIITVESVLDLGRYDDTYCFNEPEKHAGIFNGILTSNCSEITEYSSPDEIAVCNLASVSLPKFVQTNLDGTKYFNFDELGKIIQIIVVNLNNIVDINYYPVPQTSKSNLAHRPIGIGVQGLADCYLAMNYSFDSIEATKLNKQIFETIYWNGLKCSNQLAIQYGKYNSFDGSPFSKGLLQFHLAGYTTEQISDEILNYDWKSLIESIKKFGTRNSLITTIMPTASTAQILNNNESIEPYTSNIYVRKVLAGEYMIINKHLVNDLKKINMWNNQIIDELLYDNGSVKNLNIPIELKNKYKTAYELKQSTIVKQAIDRGVFIDQSQSMNLFMEMPDHNKLASAHIYGWKNGLKTGSYYIRTKPITEATKFSIDIEQINSIKSKRNTNSTTDVCESCSA